MNEQRKPVITQDQVGALTQMVRTLRLVWRLLNDPRVPFLLKLTIPAALVYVVSPVDLIPDVILGLGQLDDLGVVILAIGMFIQFCPPDIVEEHRRAIAGQMGNGTPTDENVIDGSFHEIKDEEHK